MKTKILIIAPVRLDGVDREPGEDAEIDESLLNRWIELGYCEIPKEPAKEPAREPEKEPAKEPEKEPEKEQGKEPDQRIDQQELKHLGGGYYEMPDGSKVHGKEAALETLKNFDVLSRVL